MTAALPLPALDLLRETFHYDPTAGRFTYLQQRGPRAPGAPAGTNVRGIPSLYLAGSYWRAAAVAWALFYGADPAPLHPVPIDGDPCNLRIANLALSEEPYRRPNHIPGRRPAGRPAWYRSQIRYSAIEGVWMAWHNRRLLGHFCSRPEAMAAKRAAIRQDQSQLQQENEQ